VASIERRLPSVDEYLELRRSVGWKVPGAVEAERALRQSTATLCAVGDGHLLGLGRLVGDGAFYLFVVDLIVRPEHQHRGVGSLLLAGLEAEAARISSTGTLALVADLDVAPFYERQGYQRATSPLLTKALFDG
jgi:GNAT superfamily N-acetyltransferase